MRDDAYGPLSGRLGLEGGRLASPRFRDQHVRRSVGIVGQWRLSAT